MSDAIEVNLRPCSKANRIGRPGKHRSLVMRPFAACGLLKYYMESHQMTNRVDFWGGGHSPRRMILC